MPPDPLIYQRAAHMRRRLTPPEARLWLHLKGSKLDGSKFRRQHPVGTYILDFYCTAAKLASEIDGAVHGHPDQIAHDRRRTDWLAAQGIVVLRYPALTIRDGLEHVLAEIRFVVSARTSRSGAASPSTASRSPSPALRAVEES